MADIRLTIPNYIEASSPKGLRRLMLLTNARVGGFLQFFNIQSYTNEQNKLVWMAWYYEPVQSEKDLTQSGSEKVGG